jgi:DNA polymerase III epsilon subunit-like protein
MRNIKHFWVDTETTGLDSRKHFAFQISYLIEEEGEILFKRTLEMRPDNYADFEFTAEAEQVHGFSKEKVIALAPESEQFKILLSDLDAYADKQLTICGYKIDFDIYFLKELFGRNAKWNLFYRYFYPMPFDVLQFAQGFRVAGLLNLPNLELETVCAHFAIDTSGAHNSMADIENTYTVYRRLLLY